LIDLTDVIDRSISTITLEYGPHLKNIPIFLFIYLFIHLFISHSDLTTAGHHMHV